MESCTPSGTIHHRVPLPPPGIPLPPRLCDDLPSNQDQEEEKKNGASFHVLLVN